MPRKNHFNVWIGPSDTRGRIMATDEQLLAEASREARAFIMDYTVPTEATGEVFVDACSPGDVDAAIAACETFAPHLEYPPMWLENLRAARAALARVAEPVSAETMVTPPN
jgi:hypothetical protein